MAIKLPFKNFNEKFEYLNNLYYNVGNQLSDFELSYMDKEKDIQSKWRKWSIIGFDVENKENKKWVKLGNNRTILKNEVVLDLEEADRYEEILEKLKSQGLSFRAFKTGSVGYHFHLLFRNEVSHGDKLKIIKCYDCDTQKSSERCMIALEFVPHWKTGRPKELIEEVEGANSGVMEILSKNNYKENIDDSKLDEKEKKGAVKIFGIEGQAQYFIEHQPLFFDRAGLWWMWSFDKFKWEMIDEVDVLNGIKKDGVDTISSKNKAEIITALKQVGRNNIPKMVEKNWIQFKNQIIDLESGEIFEATPNFFITNPIPWGIGKCGDTPTFDKYFKEWVVKEGLQDESYVDTLYEIIAYSCMSKQFLQRMFAFVGSGSNGKGVFLSILGKVLGEDNCCSSELSLLASNIFEASALYKKQACFMGEVDAYDMQNTNTIKKLSGEDKMRYCFKGKTAFTEKSSTTCLMNTNSLPVTPDKSKGFYRRWLIIDFPHEFPVGRDILAEISDEEFENLSFKIIEISKRLLKNKKFTNEGNLDTRIKRYEDRSNPLMSFIENNCNEDPSLFLSLQEFSKNFNQYLKNNRLRQMTPIKISRALKDEGFNVAPKKIMITEWERVNTTCVYGLNIKKEDLSTQTHSNPLLSQLDTHVDNELEKQWVPMGSDGQVIKFKVLKKIDFMVLKNKEPIELKLEQGKIYSQEDLGDDSEKTLLTLEMDKFIEVIKDGK